MRNHKTGFSDEYLQDYLSRLAHHSSAIEGNTISLADTVTILVHNTIPNKVSKREFFEIENHKLAFQYMMDKLQDGEDLSIEIVQGIHARLMDRLLINLGEFKQDWNAILGVEFSTASPQDTPFLMKQWVDNLNYRLSLSNQKEEKISIILEAHIELERIHPFQDGNGRTGRLIMNYSLLKVGIAPLIIQGKDRTTYINMLANQDVGAFTKFSLALINKEQERIHHFMNKESVQINIEDSE